MRNQQVISGIAADYAAEQQLPSPVFKSRLVYIMNFLSVKFHVFLLGNYGVVAVFVLRESWSGVCVGVRVCVGV